MLSIKQLNQFYGESHTLWDVGMEITEGPADARTLTVSTQGPTVTIDAATLINLGQAAVLGVARLTDTVDASAAMATYMAAVVTALNTIAAAVPVIIVPRNGQQSG